MYAIRGDGEADEVESEEFANGDQVHDESMEYQSQTMQGGAAKDAYR